MVTEETRKARRKKTAEVFTPPTLVNEILDKLPEEVWAEEKTFCDPSAGNGNFLVEVYRRKVEAHNHDPLIALGTIYGVELMQDNVDEMRDRLLKLAVSYGIKQPQAIDILHRNIVCHDALTYDYRFGEPKRFMFGGFR
jgi:hypothetical protein